jgi:tRNA (guanine37-N1)-methyltransferase
MRFDIVTIFPDFFQSVLARGIVRRALNQGLVTIAAHDLREYTHDKHRSVDDRPFGGGEGMVLKPEPLAEALEKLGVGPKSRQGATSQLAEKDSQGSTKCQGTTSQLAEKDPQGSTKYQGTTSVVPRPSAEESGALAPEMHIAGSGTRVILLSAQGKLFTQSVARELARLDRVVLVCGRYEGVDERINELYCDQELSIGDYVLSGGELAAAVVIDATMRLIPGVLGNEASGVYESFGAPDAKIAAEIDADVKGVPRSQHGAGGLVDYPQYTRPAEFMGLRAPDVLMNGDHSQIRRWRREQQLKKTLTNRPDLLARAALSDEDARILEEIRRGNLK